MTASPSHLDGIRSATIATARLRTHVLESGPSDGRPMVFLHGNLSSATWWEELMLTLPPDIRAIAPDLRGFGDTEPLEIDATRGARDWSDDLKALLDALYPAAIPPIHLVGWSLGGGVAMTFLRDWPHLVRTLTLISPISPYGFGGTKDEHGTPCWPDYAGSGAGLVSPDLVKGLAEHDDGSSSPLSPRNIINTFYFKPGFRAPREDAFVRSFLSVRLGEGFYPGNSAPSPHWPGVAPGTRGIVNAMSPKYFNVSDIVDLPVKPPILWIHGDADQIVSDSSMFDCGYLGQIGLMPDWPGNSDQPPQPMLLQTRAVLNEYAKRGGKYREHVVAGAAHETMVEYRHVTLNKILGFVSARHEASRNEPILEGNNNV